MVAGEDHRARSEEEASLEEGVGHEVEDAGPIGADAHADEHEPELRDGAVGEHLLDVVLEEADRGGEDRRERADGRDHRHGHGTEREEEIEPGDHVHARRDHGGGVDQRGNRRRPGHRVGEPDIERDLRALAGRADEQADADQGQHRQAEERHRAEPARHAARLVGDLVAQLAELDGGAELHSGGRDPRVRERRAEPGRAESSFRHVPGLRVPGSRQRPEEDEEADDEPEVAEPVHHEGLERGLGLLQIGVPEADQAVAAQAHALPAEEHHREVAAHHQQQHREDEQVEPEEEPPVGGLVRHVPDRIDVDERRDVRHDQRHHHAERVEGEGQIDLQRAALPHRPEVVLEEALVRGPRKHRPEGDLRHDA